MDDLRQTIETLTRAMIMSFRFRDARAVAGFYAENGLIIGPRGHRISGRKAIATYWSSLLTAKDWHLEVLDFAGQGNLAYQIARSTITHDVGGAEFTGSVDVVLIWKRQQDGTFRIRIDRYL